MPSDPLPHVHEWRDVTVVREHQVEHSPVSHSMCYVYDYVVLTQSCPCGEFRRVGIGRENERTGH